MLAAGGGSQPFSYSLISFSEKEDASKRKKTSDRGTK